LRGYQKTVCVARVTNECVQAFENYQRTNAVAPPAPVAASDPEPVYDIQSHEEKSNGKWYFEIKVDGATIQKLAEATLLLGVAQSKPEAGAANENGEATSVVFHDSANQQIAPITGTLGFAIDLDTASSIRATTALGMAVQRGSAGGQDLLRGRTYKKPTRWMSILAKETSSTTSRTGTRLCRRAEVTCLRKIGAASPEARGQKWLTRC
jgi:hypothetical protein